MTVWAFDIETDVRATPHEDGRPAGLDPRVSPVTSIAVVGDDTVRVWTGDEFRILDEFHRWLMDSVDHGDVVCTWNGAAFDWPYLKARFALHRYRPFDIVSSAIVRVPKYDLLPDETEIGAVRLVRGVHVDIAYAYGAWCAQYDVRWSLKAVAAEHGLDPGDTSGADVGDLSPAELAAYNLNDADMTYRLALTQPVLEAWKDQPA